MKNYLVLLGIVVIGTVSFSQSSDAHSKKRTKYGKVLCLDHEGNQMPNLTACRAYTSEIGPEPDRPRKRCSVSHSHNNDNSDYKVGDKVFETLEEAQADADSKPGGPQPVAIPDNSDKTPKPPPKDVTKQ